jgi:hypothetical protein
MESWGCWLGCIDKRDLCVEAFNRFACRIASTCSCTRRVRSLKTSCLSDLNPHIISTHISHIIDMWVEVGMMQNIMPVRPQPTYHHMWVACGHTHTHMWIMPVRPQPTYHLNPHIISPSHTIQLRDPRNSSATLSHIISAPRSSHDTAPRPSHISSLPPTTHTSSLPPTRFIISPSHALYI